MARRARLGVSALMLSLAAAAGAEDVAAHEASDVGGRSASGASDTIIVTARRRAEDALAVPLSLSVVGKGLIEQAYTVNPQQLTVLVPTLNYSSANPRNTALTIRGLGSSVVAVSQSNDGLEPGVGFYVDQVYHARPATAAFEFVDIDRIEVLRGPQGTLFGKNTTAGAVHILSLAPSFTPGATLEVSLGERGFFQGRGAVTGPLTDRLAVRLSGLVTTRDGIIRNVVTNADLNRIDNFALRSQFLWKPTERLSARLIADYTSFDANCCTQVFLRVGTSLRPAARQYPALAAGRGYRPASFDPDDRVTNIDADVGSNTSEGGVSLISDWDLGPATLTSVSAWRFWNWDAANDRDYTGLAIQLTQRIPSRQDQFSQELRIASNGDRALSWVGGLYFFTQKITGRPISIYGPDGAYWLIGPTTGANATPVPANLLDGYGQDGRTRFRADSYAVFGEANWRILPRLIVTGGVRYTYEEKDGQYTTTVSGGPTVTSQALINARLSVLRPQAYAARNREDNVSGRVNLSWRFTDDFNLYAVWARGFKSGGINMSGLPVDPAGNPVLTTAVIRPELNTTWEGGLKGRLWDGRVSFAVDGYYTEVKDFQATVVDSSQTVALRGYLSNVPLVTVRGFEGDVTARPVEDLELRGGVAYADGRYSRYPAGPCPLEVQTAATQACNLSGRSLAGLPRWTLTFGADWEAPVTVIGGRPFLHTDSAWRSGYNGDPSLSRFTSINAYNLTNASIGLRFARGFEFALFARNLFDARYIQNLTIQAGNSGLILGTPSEPRIIGGTFRARL